MGLLQKIIDKMLFCMTRNSRIGVFLSISVTAEVASLGSLMSTIMVLIKIGFPLQAVIVLLLSVRIMNEREILLFIILNLFSTLVSQSSSYKPGEPRSSELSLDPKNGR